MQAVKRDCNAPPTRYLNIWLCGRQTDLKVMDVRVAVANFFFWSNDRYWRDKYILVTGLGGLWAWHIHVTNLRCVQGYKI